MDEVVKWLKELGLEKYAKNFSEAEIDFETLPLLSADDLKEMLIPIGPRRKILSAIAGMTEGPEIKARKVTPVERRPLTILFCDMVASTEYATKLDPEDFSRLTQIYLRRCSALVRAHGGFVANYIGDALQALFGYPAAEEDDAERAISLAISLVQTIPQIEAPDGSRLQVRIGIASGLVVVGDFEGAPAGVSTVAFGPVPNLAQRLEALADHQTILIDQNTRDSAAGAYEFTDIGELTLKGFAKAVRAWKVIRPKSLGNRFAKRGQLARFVGRRREVADIQALAEDVKSSRQGRVLLVTGEAGIGKSRLIYESKRQLEGFNYITLQCAPAFTNSALAPFIELIKGHDAFRYSPTVTTLRELISKLDVPIATTLPVLARLLGLDQNEYPLIDLSSQDQQQVIREFFFSLLRSFANQAPIWLTIEDEQWIDPSSADLLRAIISNISADSIYLVLTSRLSSCVSLEDSSADKKITLKRLNSRDTQELCQALAQDTVMETSTANLIVSRAEGVPLYVEELCRSLVTVDGSSAPDIPVSLQSSLLSRLDKMGEGKRIAQIAAVIGREFQIDLLAHVSATPSNQLHSILNDLVVAGVLIHQPTSGWPTYSFSHALLQEVARDSLLLERRREVHRAIAQGILMFEPNLARQSPELLAQHYEGAGEYAQAADYWLEAGLRLGSTWAKVEAANMFVHGLRCLERLPASKETDRRKLKLELERGDVLYATFGYVTSEGSAAYEHVMRLSEELEDIDAGIRALDGLFGTALNSAKFADAGWASERLITLGETNKNRRALVLGLQFKGMCLFSLGKLKEAKQYLERALQHRNHAEEIGSDFPSMAMSYLSWTLQILGESDSARHLYLEAEKDARQQSSYNLAACLGNGCILMAMRQDVTAVSAMVDELIPLAEKNGFQLWHKIGLFFKGWVTVYAEHDGSGLEEMRRTCDNLGQQLIDKTCYLCLLATATMELGDFANARIHLAEGLDVARTTGESYFLAELLRLEAVNEFHLNGSEASARAALQQAVQLARNQGARIWENRAVATLTKLEEEALAANSVYVNEQTKPHFPEAP